jgi:ATP-dependent DNA helicase RecG
MTPQELHDLLATLTRRPEGRVVEFKSARTQYDEEKLGRYFTALANEANLTTRTAAWIILGVDDTGAIVGTDYLRGDHDERQLRMKVEEGTQPRTGFRDIYSLDTAAGRVLLFEIPPSPRGIPMAWKGHYYARDGDSLVPLALDKQDEIRQQTLAADWTAVVVPDATVNDLDPDALATAREAFISRHRESADAIPTWSTLEFTDRARITRKGQITRAALLLLGRPESGVHLSPHMAQMTWQLLGEQEAYSHFGPPFLLQTSHLYQRIRNVQLQLLRPDTLLPDEVAKYDQRTILEAVHNCLAHQDYTMNGRIVVAEYPDRLEFFSRGSFYLGQPDEYVTTKRVPDRYRNPFLVQAMANLGMIDTMGYGIRMMAERQAQRFLPLPDYDLSDPSRVKLTVYGRVVDVAYTQLLMRRTDLALVDILALDRVQKGLPIDAAAKQRLRRERLIEGRSPHVHVAASIAAATDSKSEYIRARAQPDAHYAALVLDYLTKFGSAVRRDINDMLMPVLSDALTEQQKRNKISNLLSKMRRAGQIRREGPRSAAVWRQT